MKTKKILSLLMMGVLTTSVFVGCGNSNASKGATSSNEKVELKFWHTYSDTEDKVFTKEVLPAFEKKYPNIKIKPVKMPTEGLKQQVVQGVAGSAAPDMMRMDIVWVPEFAKTGALNEVGGMEGFNELKGKCFDAPMATNSWQGKYYGIPLDTNTKIAIYNKAALTEAGLTEAPKSFDDLIAAADKIKGKHKNGLIGVAGNDGWGMAPYFLSLGGKYCDEKYTKASGFINSAESVAALEKLVKLKDDGILGKCLLGGQPGTWDGVKKDGNYLMIDDGPWFDSILTDKDKKSTSYSLMPKGSAGSISVVGGQDIVMFKNCKHPKEAWTFMKFLLENEPQKIMALKASLIPTNKDAANDAEVTKNEVLKLYVDQTKTAWARIPNPNWEQMNDKISKAFEKAMRKKGQPKQVLDDLAKELDPLFAAK